MADIDFSALLENALPLIHFLPLEYQQLVLGMIHGEDPWTVLQSLYLAMGSRAHRNNGLALFAVAAVSILERMGVIWRLWNSNSRLRASRQKMVDYTKLLLESAGYLIMAALNHRRATEYLILVLLNVAIAALQFGNTRRSFWRKLRRRSHLLRTIIAGLLVLTGVASAYLLWPRLRQARKRAFRGLPNIATALYLFSNHALFRKILAKRRNRTLILGSLGVVFLAAALVLDGRNLFDVARMVVSLIPFIE